MTLSILRTWLPVLAVGLAIGVVVYGVSVTDELPAPGRNQQALVTEGGEARDTTGKERPGERARRIATETRRLEAPETVDDDWEEVETKRIPIRR
jgi:hypothetical protein